MAQQQGCKQHIMISYNWGTQAFAKEINTLLVEEGYRVWMDVNEGSNDGMRENVIKGITEAVNNACLILVFATEAYERSFNCQTEINTAYSKKVPMMFLKHSSYRPGGEMGTFINNNLYHVFDVAPDGKTKLVDTKLFLDDLAHRFPATHPVRASGKRRILLVGCAGSGKSSLASLLVNGYVLRGLNPHDIYVSANPIPGTWQTAEYHNDKFSVVDTIGVGIDANATNPFGSAEAVKNLKDFLLNSRKGFHYVFFVAESGRNFVRHMRAYKLFYEVLFADIRNRFVLILTHCDDDRLKHSEALVTSSFPGIENIIPIDIPACQKMDETDFRMGLGKEALQKINAFINQNKDLKVKVPAVSLLQRNMFYNFVRKIMNVLGYQWDDKLEQVFVDMEFTPEERDITRNHF